MDGKFLSKMPIEWSSIGDTRHLINYSKKIDGSVQFEDRLKVYYEDKENGEVVYKTDVGYIETIHRAQVDLDMKTAIDPISYQLKRGSSKTSLYEKRTLRKPEKGDTQTKIVAYTMLCDGILHEVPYENVIGITHFSEIFLDITKGTIMSCNIQREKAIVRVKTPVYHTDIPGYDVEILSAKCHIKTDEYGRLYDIGSHYEEMYDKRVITERSHFLLATKTHDIQLSEEWCNSLFVPKTELSYIDLSKTNEQIKRYVTAVNLDNIMKICKIIPKKFDGRDSYIGFCKGSIDGETLFFAEAGRLYMMCDDYRMPQTGSYLHIEKMGKNAKGCFVSKWSVISKERGVLKNAYLGGDVLTDLKFKDEECKVLFKYLKGIKRVYLHWKT